VLQNREPERQRLRGRLLLLTFFGEARKVSSRRATPEINHEEHPEQIKEQTYLLKPIKNPASS
jgi:hypothetical protein